MKQCFLLYLSLLLFLCFGCAKRPTTSQPLNKSPLFYFKNIDSVLQPEVVFPTLRYEAKKTSTLSNQWFDQQNRFEIKDSLKRVLFKTGLHWFVYLDWKIRVENYDYFRDKDPAFIDSLFVKHIREDVHDSLFIVGKIRLNPHVDSYLVYLKRVFWFHESYLLNTVNDKMTSFVRLARYHDRYSYSFSKKQGSLLYYCDYEPSCEDSFFDLPDVRDTVAFKLNDIGFIELTTNRWVHY